MLLQSHYERGVRSDCLGIAFTNIVSYRKYAAPSEALEVVVAAAVSTEVVCCDLAIKTSAKNKSPMLILLVEWDGTQLASKFREYESLRLPVCSPTERNCGPVCVCGSG